MKKILLIADSNMSLSGVPVVYMSIVRQLHSEYTFDIIVLKDNAITDRGLDELIPENH